MYTSPAITVGLASRTGAGSPLTTGGCQCHTWFADAAFDGVNAVALLNELCCGPCRYWGQSRLGPAVRGEPATATWGTCTTPISPIAAVSVRTGAKPPNLAIATPRAEQAAAQPDHSCFTSSADSISAAQRQPAEPDQLPHIQRRMDAFEPWVALHQWRPSGILQA